MSDAFYTRMAATASKLLDKFGSTVTVIRNVGSSINPVTGVVTSGSNTTLTAKGLLNKFTDDLIDGTRIKASDRMLMIDATFEPVMTDKPTIAGQNWSIVEIRTVKPANVPVMYALQVRR